MIILKISYKNLFILLEQKNIAKTELQKNINISSATLAKLSKGEMVSLKVIEDICNYLNCQPGEILAMEQNIDNGRLLNTLLEEKSIKLKGGLYHQTQIKLAYNSNHMEGSRLSEEQTRCIYETNTVGAEDDGATRIDDIMETVNHFRCFDFILDNADCELTEEFIKTLHKMLKSNTSDSQLEWFAVGDYKKKPNVVGDKKTTPPTKVLDAMKSLLFEYKNKENITIEDIIEFHYFFESIHPFQNGNGRVGRLIIFKECLKHNIIPFIIEETHKWYYYRGLNEFEAERGYLLDTCLSEQDKYKELVEYFNGDTK